MNDDNTGERVTDKEGKIFISKISSVENSEL